jgi:hypothetical protein
MKLADDADLATRRDACASLAAAAELGYVEAGAVAVLGTHLEDPDPTVVAECCLGICEYGRAGYVDDSLAPLLLRKLTSPTATVRWAAAAALTMHAARGRGSAEWVSAIRPLLDDTDDWVRGYACRALSELARNGFAEDACLLPLAELTEDASKVEVMGTEAQHTAEFTVGRLAGDALDSARRTLAGSRTARLLSRASSGRDLQGTGGIG